MPAYILKGESKEVDKILRENRIRISRGVISITPAEPETALDEYSVKTLIESHSALGEERVQLIAEKNRLAELAGLVVSIAVEGGQTIPEEIAGRLAKFGVIVPKIGETADNTAENGETADETVPDTAETGNAPEAMDDKHVEVEDMQEADLDSDDKAPVTDDTKDAQADDAKETASSRKTSKRSKKSE